MKKALIYALAAAFLCLGAHAMAQDKGPENIVVNPEGKKPATFPHHMHQERMECGVCHHGRGDDGKQVAYKEGQEIGKCVSCHNPDVLGKDNKLSKIKEAGHGNCLSCHKEEAKKDAAKKNLKKCSTCHKKKK